MSIRLMARLWEYELTAAEHAVLAAMCDHAKEDGSDCYPGAERTAWKARLSVRHTQRIWAELEERGILERETVHTGRGQIQGFRIHINRAPRRESFEERAGIRRRRRETLTGSAIPAAAMRSRDTVSPDPGVRMVTGKGDIVSPDRRERVTSETGKGDIGAPERVTSETGKGDIRDAKTPVTDTPVGISPSLNLLKPLKPEKPVAAAELAGVWSRFRKLASEEAPALWVTWIAPAQLSADLAGVWVFEVPNPWFVAWFESHEALVLGLINRAGGSVTGFRVLAREAV